MRDGQAGFGGWLVMIGGQPLPLKRRSIGFQRDLENTRDALMRLEIANANLLSKVHTLATKVCAGRHNQPRRGSGLRTNVNNQLGLSDFSSKIRIAQTEVE